MKRLEWLALGKRRVDFYAAEPPAGAAVWKSGGAGREAAPALANIDGTGSQHRCGQGPKQQPIALTRGRAAAQAAKLAEASAAWSLAFRGAMPPRDFLEMP